MEASQVTVEVHLANGLVNFTIIGFPETEVKESKGRLSISSRGHHRILKMARTITDLVRLCKYLKRANHRGSAISSV